MTLKLIVVSVITLLALNSCNGKTEYIQPKLPILTEYKVKVLDDISYTSIKNKEDIEYVVTPTEFDRMVNWIKKADDANGILNKEIRKYNRYAKEQNSGK